MGGRLRKTVSQVFIHRVIAAHGDVATIDGVCGTEACTAGVHHFHELGRDLLGFCRAKIHASILALEKVDDRIADACAETGRLDLTLFVHFDQSPCQTAAVERLCGFQIVGDGGLLNLLEKSC